MGCDIHIAVEVHKNGHWTSANEWETDCDSPRIKYEVYTSRNYRLFGILANVRNGSGFAGVKTGEAMIPISEPRGFPSDLSPEVAKWATNVQHTPSWLTVAELIAYDWTQTTHLQGYVDYSQWALFKQRGAPERWSSSVGGGNVVHRTAKAFDDAWGPGAAWTLYHSEPEAVARMDAALGPHSNYALIHWTLPYYRAAGTEFLSETMPKLWRLGKPEDVRIVFFFDN